MSRVYRGAKVQRRARVWWAVRLLRLDWMLVSGCFLGEPTRHRATCHHVVATGVSRRYTHADQQNVLDYPALHWATASIENDARNSEGVGAGKMNRDVAGRVQYRRGAARRDHDHFHSLPSFNP